MTANNPFKAARILETIENFSVSDDISIKASKKKDDEGGLNFLDAESFWKAVLNNPSNFWNKKINTGWFVLSSWVARVPGLYWTPTAQIMREKGFEHIAEYDGRSIELFPGGKSRMVEGGLGTIKIAPDDDGKSLFSICTYADSSEGIPVLIFPDVIDKFKLKEGFNVRLSNATWQSMSVEWAKRFAFTKEVPRGVLIVNHASQMEIKEDNVPIKSYPFSIMEYDGSNSKLFDYVFAQVDDISKPAMRKRAENFFRDYAAKDSRYGRYLLNTNLVDPLFEADFMSPSDMQLPSQKAKLDLLYARIKDLSFSKTNLDKLIDILPENYESSTAIRTLARNIGVKNSFLQDDDAASMSSQLINYCLKSGKIEELTARMCTDYPEIFKI